MTLSAFPDKSHPPAPEELKRVLGPSAEIWERLVAHMAAAYPPITELWNSAGAKSGWSLRLKRKDRILLYLIPQAGQFLLGVVLGEKAAKTAHSGGYTKRVLDLIDAAPRYAEGRGIRFAILDRDDLAAAQALAALKMAP